MRTLRCPTCSPIAKTCFAVSRRSTAHLIVCGAPQPLPTFLQHQSFLEADQPAFQLERPAAQSYGKDVIAATGARAAGAGTGTGFGSGWGILIAGGLITMACCVLEADVCAVVVMTSHPRPWVLQQYCFLSADQLVCQVCQPSQQLEAAKGLDTTVPAVWLLPVAQSTGATVGKGVGEGCAVVDR